MTDSLGDVDSGVCTGVDGGGVEGGGGGSVGVFDIVGSVRKASTSGISKSIGGIGGGIDGGGDFGGGCGGGGGDEGGDGGTRVFAAGDFCGV